MRDRQNDGINHLKEAIRKHRTLNIIKDMPPDAILVQDAEGRHWVFTGYEQLLLDVEGGR